MSKIFSLVYTMLLFEQVQFDFFFQYRLQNLAHADQTAVSEVILVQSLRWSLS